MTDSQSVAIFTTPHYSSLFKLNELNAEVVVLELQDMVKAFLANGGKNDICVMPFLPRYQDLLKTFRAKSLHGTVMFVSSKDLSPQVVLDIYSLGAMFVDLRHERPAFIHVLLLFLSRPRSAEEVQDREKELLEQLKIARSVQGTYERGAAKQDKPASDIIQKLDAEKEDRSGIPETVPLAGLIDNAGFKKAAFAFSIEVDEGKSKKKLPFSGMARLKSTFIMEDDDTRFRLFFERFQPYFAVSFFQKVIQSITPETHRRLLENPNDPEFRPYVVQLTVSVDDVFRSFILTPTAIKNETVEFISLGDLFLQKRRYFRVVPTDKTPIKAFISTDRIKTSEVPIVDLSERGLCFQVSQVIPQDEIVSTYLEWEKDRVVCQSVVRFSGKMTDSNMRKIGTELFQNETDCDALREYIFDSQVDILRMLKTD